MILLKEMTSDQFKQYGEFSYQNFLKEMSLATSKKIEEVKVDLIENNEKNPVTTNAKKDLWRVVEFEGEEIGYIWVQVDYDARTAFGFDIFLDPEYRGRGLGRLVMRQGRELLKEKDIEKVVICVFHANGVARSLYESLGFTEDSFNEETQQYRLFMNL